MYVLDMEEKNYDGLHFAFRHFKAVVALLDMCLLAKKICLGMF